MRRAQRRKTHQTSILEFAKPGVRISNSDSLHQPRRNVYGATSEEELEYDPELQQALALSSRELELQQKRILSEIKSAKKKTPATSGLVNVVENLMHSPRTAREKAVLEVRHPERSWISALRSIQPRPPSESGKSYLVPQEKRQSSFVESKQYEKLGKTITTEIGGSRNEGVSRKSPTRDILSALPPLAPLITAQSARRTLQQGPFPTARANGVSSNSPTTPAKQKYSVRGLESTESSPEILLTRPARFHGKISKTAQQPPEKPIPQYARVSRSESHSVSTPVVKTPRRCNIPGRHIDSLAPEYDENSLPYNATLTSAKKRQSEPGALNGFSWSFLERDESDVEGPSRSVTPVTKANNDPSKFKHQNVYEIGSSPLIDSTGDETRSSTQIPLLVIDEDDNLGYSSDSKTTCPICGLSFRQSIIAQHSSSCLSNKIFSSPAKTETSTLSKNCGSRSRSDYFPHDTIVDEVDDNYQDDLCKDLSDDTHDPLLNSSSDRNDEDGELPPLSPLKGLINLNELQKRGELGHLAGYFNQFNTSKSNRGGSSSKSHYKEGGRSRARTNGGKDDGSQKRHARFRKGGGRGKRYVRGRGKESQELARSRKAQSGKNEESYNYYANEPDFGNMPESRGMRWESGVKVDL